MNPKKPVGKEGGWTPRQDSQSNEIEKAMKKLKSATIEELSTETGLGKKRISSHCSWHVKRGRYKKDGDRYVYAVSDSTIGNT